MNVCHRSALSPASERYVTIAVAYQVTASFVVATEMAQYSQPASISKPGVCPDIIPPYTPLNNIFTQLFVQYSANLPLAVIESKNSELHGDGYRRYGLTARYGALYTRIIITVTYEMRGVFTIVTRLSCRHH